LHTFFAARGQRQATVVALYGTAREDRVGALLQGIGHDKLELARLVATAGQPGLVVPLDPQSDTRRILGGVVVSAAQHSCEVG